jgi:hypothetical protein
MSRAGYTEADCDAEDMLRQYGWQANVRRAIAGRKGQAFLWELYLSLEVLPKRELITGALVDSQGCACALGAVALTRGMDIPSEFTKLYGPSQHEWSDSLQNDVDDDGEFADAMGPLFGIKDMLAREIMYVNDEMDRWHWADTGDVCHGVPYGCTREVRHHDLPDERWQRVRRWVVSNLRDIP